MAPTNRNEWHDYIARFAPDHEPIILKSPSSALKLADHQDPRVRCAALVAGFAIWSHDLDSGFVARFREATRDESEDVKHVALVALTSLFVNSQRRDIQRDILAIVRDVDATPLLRNCAYHSILQIERGVYTVPGSFTEMLLNAMDGESVDLASIDWGFVNKIDRGIELRSLDHECNQALDANPYVSPSNSERSQTILNATREMLIQQRFTLSASWLVVGAIWFALCLSTDVVNDITRAAYLIIAGGWMISGIGSFVKAIPWIHTGLILNYAMVVLNLGVGIRIATNYTNTGDMFFCALLLVLSVVPFCMIPQSHRVADEARSLDIDDY